MTRALGLVLALASTAHATPLRITTWCRDIPIAPHPQSVAVELHEHGRFASYVQTVEKLSEAWTPEPCPKITVQVEPIEERWCPCP